MCGIYGAFSTDAERPTRADVLERMAHVLAHRGPDGAGSHLAGPFGMGMCRLTTIDLASGDHPCQLKTLEWRNDATSLPERTSRLTSSFRLTASSTSAIRKACSAV